MEDFIRLGELSDAEKEAVEKKFKFHFMMTMEDTVRIANKGPAMKSGYTAQLMACRELGLDFKMDNYGIYRPKNGPSFKVRAVSKQWGPTLRTSFPLLQNDFLKVQDRPDYWVFIHLAGKGQAMDKVGFVAGHIAHNELRDTSRFPIAQAAATNKGYSYSAVAINVTYENLEPGFPAGLERKTNEG